MPARGSIRLPSTSPNPSGSARESPLRLRRFITKLAKSRSSQDIQRALLSRVRLSGSGLPLRIRPAFVVLTACSLFVLSALGFHPTLAKKITVESVPFWDKILHFWCFAFASAEFYAIWSVEESAREWYWRYFPEIASLVICAGVGSIGSEFVQGLLPYKTFQWGDVVANLLGTSLGMFVARSWTRAARRAREIRRLYQPVNLDHMDQVSDSSSSEDEGDRDQMENNVRREMEEGRRSRNRTAASGEVSTNTQAMDGMVVGGQRKMAKIEANVWDESDEIFGLGDDDDEEVVSRSSPARTRKGGA
ncbi:hypothetical protein T439DRAFT_376709 [Meredithblackwellia eburnea MCA 4105]